MSQEILKIANPQEIIESRVFSYWQKYINGINMSFIDCEYDLINCTFARKENTFYIMVHKTGPEFIEVSENVAFHSSLIAPILMEIAVLVNYSVHLYVSESGKNLAKIPMVLKDKIDSEDRVPNIYENEVRSGLECAKPLFLSNQFSILSPVVEGERPTNMDIMLWKTFEIRVWTLILSALFIIVITNQFLLMVRNHNTNNQNLLNLIWIYFKPLIGIGESYKYRNYLYTLWVLSVFTLTEIFRNELLAKLVAVPDVYADKIDDLLDDKWDVYTSSGDLDFWRTISAQNQINDQNLHNKYIKIFNKTMPLDYSPDGQWFSLLDEPKKFLKKIKRSALIEDDQELKFYEMMFRRLIPTHFGKESYVPKLITPLCYSPNFKFKKEAEKVTLRLFEVSLLDHWYEVKGNFHTTIGLKLLKMFKGDILSKFYDYEQNFKDLKFMNIQFMLLWLLYCYVLNAIYLLIEVLFSKII